MGHQPPNAQWFEKGLLAAMEDLTPQPAAATPATSDPAKKTLSQKEEAPSTAPSTAKPSPSDEADKLLRNAKVYIDNQLFKQARDRLENILANFPDTPAAKEAKELLRQIRTNE
jgi:hypothetical protein